MTRTYVVTGAAGGIGGAVVGALSGHRVIGVDVRLPEESRSSESAVGSTFVTVDLADPAQRRDGLSRVRAEVGERLDGLVVCAGLGSHVTPTSLIARVNTFAALESLDALRDLLQAGDDPAAVVIGSNSAGLVPSDHPLVALLVGADEGAAVLAAEREDGALVYPASKRALTTAVRRRSASWAEHGIRLNVVAPGPVRTALLQGALDHPVHGDAVRAYPVPLGRHADPTEVAGIVAFLLGPQAGFVHGAVWYVDGGTDALLRPDLA